jgi:drug/metabolite transporter (DMT)-like permease
MDSCESIDRQDEAAGFGSSRLVKQKRSRATMLIPSLTVLAIIAFAANSVLCRLALGNAAIDPTSYTAVRLLSGAIVLWIIALARTNASPISSAGSWTAGGLLFLYALSFSFAYLRLGAGAGALILFASVQLTMIGAGLWSGERSRSREWAGWVIASVGFLYLLAPGIASPPFSGSLLMALSGIAWGGYSLLGRSASDPIQATAGNFLRAAPLALIAGLALLPSLSLSPVGLFSAVLSGAIASGLGYVVWYAALKSLTAAQAATVQLSVPVIAAFGGVFLLSRPACRSPLESFWAASLYRYCLP